MNTYVHFDEYLKHGMNKDDRPLKNNTRVIRINENKIGIKLHDTFVLIFDQKENNVMINTDGWQTKTTKERINDFGPNGVGIYVKDRIWYIGHDDKIYFYKDNIKYHIDKQLLTDVNDVPLKPITPQLLKSKNSWKNKINKYCNEFAERFVNGKIKKPSEGDCWYCTFIDNDNNDHLISHMKSKYYVPALLNNALIKYKDNLSEMDKHNIACMWLNDDKEHEPIYLDMTKDRIKKVLKKYMFHKLGFAN